MLKLHFAEAYQPSEGICPMVSAMQHNFVSQLCTSQISFSEHEGPLSIKCCFQGEETYTLQDRRVVVDASSYLILNQGQPYASLIESKGDVESFCVWFRPAFAEQVLRSLKTPADRLMAEPYLPAPQSTLFFERPFPHDVVVSPLLRCMREAIVQENVSQGWLEEQFHRLLERLLHAHKNVYADMERLPAVRESTRLELSRQLYQARDFLDSTLGRPVMLHEAANVACLSEHHFLRQFKHLFDETPHQYHRRKRLEHARHLLTTTELPVTDICFTVGFESLGSFSTLFHNLYAVSPTQYRAQFGAKRTVRLMAQEPILTFTFSDESEHLQRE